MTFLNTAIQVASGWVSLETSVAGRSRCLLTKISASLAANVKPLVPWQELDFVKTVQ